MTDAADMTNMIGTTYGVGDLYSDDDVFDHCDPCNEIPYDSSVYNRALELMEQPLDRLIPLARQESDRHPGHIGASPVILTGACTTDPPCRHCKWRYFKALGKPAFVYDATPEKVRQRMHELAASGVKRAFTATGWMGYHLPKRYLEMVHVAHQAEPGIELYGLFGALDRESHLALADVGLTGMLTSLESPSEMVFHSFRPGGDSLQDRIRSFDYVREAGLKLWSGFLVGLDETAQDVARGIAILALYAPESVSILPFEPYPDTEMADHAPTDPAWLARAVAVGRICLPKTHYFFTDHAGPFCEIYADAIGMNGTYETGGKDDHHGKD